MSRLLDYLNTNPDLPALDDIGCSWRDVTELIDSYQLFYSKAFKNRTTYLSINAYYLLKAIKGQKALTDYYGTATEWESYAPKQIRIENANEQLWKILSHVMSKEQYGTLIR